MCNILYNSFTQDSKPSCPANVSFSKSVNQLCASQRKMHSTLHLVGKGMLIILHFVYFIPDDKGICNAKLCQIILTCIVEVSIKETFGAGGTDSQL